MQHWNAVAAMPASAAWLPRPNKWRLERGIINPRRVATRARVRAIVVPREAATAHRAKVGERLDWIKCAEVDARIGAKRRRTRAWPPHLGIVLWDRVLVEVVTTPRSEPAYVVRGGLLPVGWPLLCSSFPMVQEVSELRFILGYVSARHPAIWVRKRGRLNLGHPRPLPRGATYWQPTGPWRAIGRVEWARLRRFECLVPSRGQRILVDLRLGAALRAAVRFQI